MNTTTTPIKTKRKENSRKQGMNLKAIDTSYMDEEVKRLHQLSKRIVPKEIIEKAIKKLRSMQFDSGEPYDCVEIIRSLR